MGASYTLPNGTDQSRFLEALLEHTLSAVYLFNVPLRTNTYINRRYTEVTGYTLEDLQNLDPASGGIMSLIHPDDMGEVLERFGKDPAHDTAPIKPERALRIRHKDGHWVWHYTRYTVYSRDSEGKPLEVLGTFVDITSLKSHEAQLQTLAAQNAATFEQAAVGMAHVGLDGQFTKVNSRLLSILGCTRAELLEKRLDDITLEEYQVENRTQVQALLDGEAPDFSSEQPLLNAQGTPVWANLSVTLARQGDTPLHYIVVLEEITARKKIEQALEESNAALERFAYSASHDLQEPLRKICAFASALERRLSDQLEDHDAKFELSRISDAARRMTDMINGLLHLSRYTKTVLEKRPLQCSALLQLVKENLEFTIESSNASIHLNNDFVIYGDSVGMQLVLTNLIHNSIQYARPEVPPEITIRTEQGDHKQIITVSDNGRGTAAENCDRIFEAFTRFADKTITGTGMGLAICRQVVKAHNGSIRAHSALNEGMEITIELPLEEQTS